MRCMPSDCRDSCQFDELPEQYHRGGRPSLKEYGLPPTSLHEH
jgi:hypothetical protein